MTDITGQSVPNFLLGSEGSSAARRCAFYAMKKVRMQEAAAFFLHSRLHQAGFERLLASRTTMASGASSTRSDASERLEPSLGTRKAFSREVLHSSQAAALPDVTGVPMIDVSARSKLGTKLDPPSNPFERKEKMPSSRVPH